jgi:serine/threonine protein kinase
MGSFGLTPIQRGTGYDQTPDSKSSRGALDRRNDLLIVSPGTKLGRYEIRSKIGEGGMGEVYRAYDPAMHREVAIKLLPAAFSTDKGRLARFEQEAQTAGALNHPNILVIHHIETHEGAPYIVSELLEGETLRQRLSGAALAQRRAIDYANQIAHGLAAAHEKGIVHRDLKPDNIFVTKDGRVKILDFGIAKLTEPEGSPSQTQIPTRRVDTDPGTVMGTVGYMSPEQLTGKSVDHRSDIFSFGAILYEMLSGRRAFHGESAAETMSAILKEDPPDLSETNQNISPALERLVNHCLEKTPEARFHSARDLAFALEALSGSTSLATQTIVAPATTPQWFRRHALTGWIIAACAILLAIIVFGFVYFRGPGKTEIAKTSFYVSTSQSSSFSGASDFISPDGRLIVFPAEKDGKRALWIRPLEALEAQRLPDTEEATQVFWSPDSRFIGFFAGGKLKKMEVSGGAATTLIDGVANRGATWNRDGVIVFSLNFAGPLYRISSAGGPATQVTTLDTTRNENTHAWPHFLPDGRHFLYLARSALREKSAIYVGSVDAKESKFVISADSTPSYAPPGYLLFLRERTLMAQPFDADKLQVTGDAFPIAEQVGYNPVNGRAFFSVSDNGVLVYRTRVSSLGDRQLAWFDRTGKQISQLGSPGQILSVTLSPDGKRIAETRADSQSGQQDIWIIEQERESRFTFDPANEASPVWSPDGSQIAFNSSRSGWIDIYVKASNGAGTEELLYKSNDAKGPHDWSPDGRYILFGDLDPKTFVDLWILPLFGDQKPYVFLQTPFSELQGRFSPSGRWIAYSSNESGITQIYVRPFQASGGQRMVSTNGGEQPKWRADGKELFYVSADRKLTAVDVNEVGGTITFSSPKPLFEIRAVVGAPGADLYAPTRDGQRFVVITPIEESSASPLTVVLNWTAGLKK